MLSECRIVKPIFKCDDIHSKEIFRSSQCLLTISVGQEVHEADKFAATVELVNNNFASCIMLIDDSLQRHTMALQSVEDPDSFYECSLREGDFWLKRNEKYFSNLGILKKIIRWDKWLKHPDYHEKKEHINALLEADPSYKQFFDSTIQEFLRRYYGRFNPIFNVERDYSLCFDYLVEECTALCLWPELNCHFEVYPSRRNLAMDATHKRFVLPNHPNLLHALAIKFKNRKQLKPQSFELLSERVG